MDGYRDIWINKWTDGQTDKDMDWYMMKSTSMNTDLLINTVLILCVCVCVCVHWMYIYIHIVDIILIDDTACMI